MNSNVFLSLGSNIGDKIHNLTSAIEALNENNSINILIKSNIYKTSPMYNNNQTDFYNMIIKIGTSLSPSELLGMIKFIELKLGRKTSKRRNMPRVIDIDILTFNDEELNTEVLTIPHQRLYERKFVLLPWEEIAPDYYISQLRKRVKELLRDIDDDNKIKILKKELI